jgi:hypothetical protein
MGCCDTNWRLEGGFVNECDKQVVVYIWKISQSFWHTHTQKTDRQEENPTKDKPWTVTIVKNFIAF